MKLGVVLSWASTFQVAHAATSACDVSVGSPAAATTWTKGGTRTTATLTSPAPAPAGVAAQFCGSHATQTSWGELLPYSGTAPTAGCAVETCTGTDYAKCCESTCGHSTWTGGTGTDAAASGATKATLYCGANKVPKNNQGTIALGVDYTTRAAPTSADLATCCADACGKVTFLAGAGTDVTTSGSEQYYCGAGNAPYGSQATYSSEVASVTANQKSTCCSNTCGKVTFAAGAGTDVTTSGSEKYFCGANKVPVANQATTLANTWSIGAGQKNTCCDDACGKVTFTAGAGTDVTTSGSENYFCGAGRIPVANQATTPSGSDSIGASQTATCCTDSCGKVTFKAGAGTDNAGSNIFFCGAGKVPVANQATTPSGSNSVGAAQKSVCCQDACGKVTFAGGTGTDVTTSGKEKYFCGAGRIPKADQGTIPSGSNSIAAAQAATCCTDACGKVSFMGGVGTDVSTAGKEKYFCGLGRIPLLNQGTIPSGSSSIGATEKSVCCTDSCGKVTFAKGAGTDVLTAGSEKFFCGANRIPVASQATVPSGGTTAVESIGAGQKSVCCTDACAKVTFKAGDGTDDAAATTFFCGKDKVPKKDQAALESGSNAIGAGQKTMCCAAACSTMTYISGEGTNKDNNLYCGKDMNAMMDQATTPCDAQTCTAAGTKMCCSASCSSTKWSMGKKPTAPKAGTMYCGEGKAPVSDLVAASCSGAACADTDVDTCCEEASSMNSSGTTGDASSSGLGLVALITVMIAGFR